MSKIKLKVKSDILSIKLLVVHDFMFKKLGCFCHVKVLPGFPTTEGGERGEGEGGRGKEVCRLSRGRFCLVMQKGVARVASRCFGVFFVLWFVK